MENSRLTVIALVVGIAIVAGLGVFYYTSFAGGAGEGKETFRIGLCMSGARGDPGWSNQAYKALQYVKGELSDEMNVKISVSEHVGHADLEKALTDYASADYDLVWGHGGEYNKVAAKVAEEYPDVHFMTTGCRESRSNLMAYNLKWGEMSYLAGILAGQVTQSNRLGVVLGATYPPIIWINESFEKGAKKVNPDAQITTTNIQTFTDPSSGKSTASALVDKGVDVLITWADLSAKGVIQEAKQEGVYYIAETQDHYSLNPDISIGYMVIDFRGIVENTVKSILNDNFSGETRTWGIKKGLLDVKVNENLVSQEKAETVRSWRQKIVSGEFQVPPDFELKD